MNEYKCPECGQWLLATSVNTASCPAGHGKVRSVRRRLLENAIRREKSQFARAEELAKRRETLIVSTTPLRWPLDKNEGNKMVYMNGDKFWIRNYRGIKANLGARRWNPFFVQEVTTEVKEWFARNGYALEKAAEAAGETHD